MQLLFVELPRAESISIFQARLQACNYIRTISLLCDVMPQPRSGNIQCEMDIRIKWDNENLDCSQDNNDRNTSQDTRSNIVS